MTILKDSENTDDYNAVASHNILGLLGILNIGNQLFIVCVKDRDFVAKLPSGDAVYLIKEVALVPFDKNYLQYS